MRITMNLSKREKKYRNRIICKYKLNQKQQHQLDEYIFASFQTYKDFYNHPEYKYNQSLLDAFAFDRCIRNVERISKAFTKFTIASKDAASAFANAFASFEQIKNIREGHNI